MNRIKRTGIYISPLLLIFAAAIVWIKILNPLAVKFIKAQIPQINASQNVAKLEVDRIDLSLLKLQLAAQGLKITFNKELSDSPPLLIENFSVQLDIFDLIIGHINLSKVVIDSGKWNYTIVSNSKAKKSPLPVDEIFKLLEIVPIERIIIYDSALQLTTPETKSLIKIQIPQLTISNKKNEISLSANSLKTQFVQNNNGELTFENDFSLSLTKNDLTINKIEMRVLDSHIGITGKFRNVAGLLTDPSGQVSFRSKLNLEDLRTITLTLFPQKSRISSVMGFIESKGELNLNSFEDIDGAVDISTTQVVLDHFKLGQAQIKATLKNNQIAINEVNIEHPSGTTSLKNVKFEKRSPYNFSTAIEVKTFDLQKLFISLGLSDIPAGLLAKGKSFCTGALYPDPTANCKIEADIQNVWVKPGQKVKLNILKLTQGNITGEAKFTREGLSYSADLRLGSSIGTSSGTLNFEEGFDIKYATDNLSFSDVESLADLNILGNLKISGTTQGNAHAGIINAEISMHDSQIDGFWLGNFASNLSYKKSILKFGDILGSLGASGYSGNINFNFSESNLDGEFKSPNLKGSELLHILNKKFELPFDLSGDGNIDLKFKGPFAFWKLSYNLNSEFNNGTIAGENFSHLDFNVAANGENITLNKVRMKKTKSELLLEGSINTVPKEPQFNIKIKANPLFLEESDQILTYAPAISGVGYAQGQISGPLNFPEININFTLNQVSYDKMNYPNSQGNLKINKNILGFSGQIFGRQIQSDIIWPWNPKDSFSAKLLIHDLNPLFLLPFVSIPQPSSEFSSKLNAEVDLTSKNRNLAAADGYIKITDFILQRGSQTLKLEKPASIIFKSGLSQIESITLKGQDSFLNIRMNQNEANLVRLNINADLQLRMLHFLIPFAQSLTGNLVLNSQILLRENHFELLGEGELTDGHIAMKGFPQSIDSINTPIEFSKSKIFLTDITGQFGQSDVSGVGQIDILGAKNIQVNLHAIADNVELNFPEKISTSGKANVLFSGNWLPYDLKIDYKVARGLVEKDFDAASTQTQTIKASSFLPPRQIEQSSSSIALDINVDLSNGIIIKNALIEGEAYGLLNISGSPESPVLKGKIDIKQNSKLIFKDKPFTIQTASINFQQTKEINPDIYISANSRVSDYDINLLVQGTAKNLVIKPTSQPPLSEPDLFSLLALGVTSQSDHNLTSDTQQKQTGLEVLAAISNQSQLNKKIQEKLGLTVQLAPAIDSTKNIAVPKVVVSKKISEKINASYTKPFTGNDQNQEIKLQYLYNNNVSVHLNYQNKDSFQQDQISAPNSNGKGIFGFDLEYRDEFK